MRKTQFETANPKPAGEGRPTSVMLGRCRGEVTGCEDRDVATCHGFTPMIKTSYSSMPIYWCHLAFCSQKKKGLGSGLTSELSFSHSDGQTR